MRISETSRGSEFVEFVVWGRGVQFLAGTQRFDHRLTPATFVPVRIPHELDRLSVNFHDDRFT